MQLKSIINKVQSAASNVESKGFTKSKFLLEILMSISHKKMKKVPNYDPEETKHFIGLYRSIIPKGLSLSSLSVSLADLMNSETAGKWWIVGSAWSARTKQDKVIPKSKDNFQFDEEFMKKAKKYKLNRAPKINILYVISRVASDNSQHAFAQLLCLGLPKPQQVEIFNVLLYLNNKYTYFNSFMASVCSKFAHHDKKHKKSLRAIVKNNFNNLGTLNGKKLENFAKFSAHLIACDSLDLTILKTFDLATLAKPEVTFITILLQALFNHPLGKAAVEKPFNKVIQNPIHNEFAGHLKVFIHKHLISKKKRNQLTDLALHMLSNATSVSL